MNVFIMATLESGSQNRENKRLKCFRLGLGLGLREVSLFQFVPLVMITWLYFIHGIHLDRAWILAVCLSSSSANFFFSRSVSCLRPAECSISPSSRLRRDLSHTQDKSYRCPLCTEMNSSMWYLGVLARRMTDGLRGGAGLLYVVYAVIQVVPKRTNCSAVCCLMKCNIKK